MAHPLKLRAIAEANVKTGKVDAETMAQLPRANSIPRSRVPSRDVRDLRQLVRRRAHLVQQSTTLKNRIHAALPSRGVRRPQSLCAYAGPVPSVRPSASYAHHGAIGKGRSSCFSGCSMRPFSLTYGAIPTRDYRGSTRKSQDGGARRRRWSRQEETPSNHLLNAPDEEAISQSGTRRRAYYSTYKCDTGIRADS